MNKIIYYSLAGGLATVIALSLIKKKPSRGIMTAQRALPGPKMYLPAPGDSYAVVAQRFGTTLQAFAAANGTNLSGLNKMITARQAVKLPPNLADTGIRNMAKGTTT